MFPRPGYTRRSGVPQASSAQVFPVQHHLRTCVISDSDSGPLRTPCCRTTPLRSASQTDLPSIGAYFSPPHPNSPAGLSTLPQDSHPPSRVHSSALSASGEPHKEVRSPSAEKRVPYRNKKTPEKTNRDQSLSSAARTDLSAAYPAGGMCTECNHRLAQAGGGTPQARHKCIFR